MDNQIIQETAAMLREAQQSGQTCNPVRDRLPDSALTTAYAVQTHNTEHYLKQGRRIVGRKIGLGCPCGKRAGLSQWSSLGVCQCRTVWYSFRSSTRLTCPGR